MTEEQYNAVQPYRSIIDHWAQNQVYVGGAGGLMDIWDRLWSTRIDRGCPNCIADMLTILHIEIRKYERDKETGTQS